MHAPNRLPPGPRGGWLLGNIRDFRRDPLGFLTHCARAHGDVSCFHLGRRRLVLLNHPELIHQVLVAENHRVVKPFNYQLLRPYVGNGLLLNEGAGWLQQRRLIQPQFLRQRLLGYVGPATRLTEQFVSAWQPGERRDLHADMMRLTLRIISGLVLGVDTGADGDTVERALEVLLADYKFRFETGIDLPRWLPTPGNLRAARAIRDLRGVIDRMIAHRRAQPGEGDDLLTRLLNARDDSDASMPEQLLRDELVTMLLAGHETTANTLTWTFDLLARHPDIEQQVADEVRGAAGIDRMPLAERVLLESMRLYPTAYLIGRRPIEDVEVGGYRVGAGDTILMSQWVTHRDPRFFERPDEFLPQRWVEGPRALPGRAYFPFGGGPRLCVGSHFAMMEALVILGVLLPRFRFRPTGAAVPWPSVTLRPRDGLPVVLEARAAERAVA